MPLGSLVNATKLQPRAGQLGVLRWTDETRITSCLEPVHTDGPYVFPYDTTLSYDFCTSSFAHECQVGEHVGLVLQVLMAEEKYTNNSGDPYLEVHGTDIEGAMVASLRLWRYANGDLTEGNTYIIRGLKVMLAKQWDAEQWKYIFRGDGSKTLECTSRTAVEDVSHIEAITAFFQ